MPGIFTNPFRFRASIPPDKIVLDHEVSMDLLWLEDVPILHIVDTHANFQSATVLRSKKPIDIWFTFIECWATLYVGYPNVIRLDQEANFSSSLFKSLVAQTGIELRFLGTEPHNSIGVEERCHDPLRRTFRKL